MCDCWPADPFKGSWKLVGADAGVDEAAHAPLLDGHVLVHFSWWFMLGSLYLNEGGRSGSSHCWEGRRHRRRRSEEVEATNTTNYYEDVDDGAAAAATAADGNGAPARLVCVS